jgi:hypothetical protein
MEQQKMIVSKGCDQVGLEHDTHLAAEQELMFAVLLQWAA